MKCYFCTWVHDGAMIEARWVVAGYSVCDAHVPNAVAAARGEGQ